MTRFEACLIPHSSLFVGGYADTQGTADGVTARDAKGLLVPGSALKGALREAASRLVRAAGHGEAELEALFGRSGDREPESVLRVGTLRAEMPSGATAPLATRLHVSLERATRSAAPALLFEHRVTPIQSGLRFRGELRASRPLTEPELELLRAAAAITDQLGGGRGRGLGWVSLTLEALSEDPPAVPALPLPTSADALERVLVLEVREPLQLAGVKDSGNFTPTQEGLDGSTLRGAVAAHLALGTGKTQLGEALLGAIAGPNPVCFGDGHPGAAGAIPAPLTLSVPKRQGAPVDEALQLAAEATTGRAFERAEDLRRASGSWYRGEAGWQRAKVVRRTVTRTARDTASGRAADTQLYTLEVVDPFVEKGVPLRYWAPVRGEPAALAAVVEAARRGIAVGGDRSRGFGGLAFFGCEEPPPLGSVAARHQAWADRLAALGTPNAEATGALLALGPIALDAARLEHELKTRGLELLAAATRRQVRGGWLRRLHLPRTVGSAFVPGSVWLVATVDGQTAAPALAALEHDGLGPGRADGWGRLVACHPVHLETAPNVPEEDRP
jgi:hypothetical protein